MSTRSVVAAAIALTSISFASYLIVDFHRNKCNITIPSPDDFFRTICFDFEPSAETVSASVIAFETRIQELWGPQSKLVDSSVNGDSLASMASRMFDCLINPNKTKYEELHSTLVGSTDGADKLYETYSKWRFAPWSRSGMQLWVFDNPGSLSTPGFGRLRMNARRSDELPRISRSNPRVYVMVPMLVCPLGATVREPILAAYLFAWDQHKWVLAESIVLKKLGRHGVGVLPF